MRKREIQNIMAMEKDTLVDVVHYAEWKSELVCLVCLGVKDSLIYVFDTVNDMDYNGYSGCRTLLSELLKEHGNIDVMTSKGLPKYICTECTNELLTTVKFRNKCKKSAQVFETMNLDSPSDKDEFEVKIHNKEINQTTFKNITSDCKDTKDEEECYSFYEPRNWLNDNLEPEQDLNNTVKISFEEYIVVNSNDITQEESENEQLKFNCDICGAAFKTLLNQQRHFTTHSIETSCQQTFGIYENLQNHKGQHQAPLDDMKLSLIDSSASNINFKKLLTCSYCRREFPCKSALNSHIRIHTGDKPFNCVKCEKTFRTQGGLALHLKRHLGIRPFKCKDCDRSFVDNSNLKVHMRIHTGEKPHICKKCGKCFSRVYLLQLHNRTHTGEKPYKCDYCVRGFAQLSDLHYHRRTHTGEKPFFCIYCNKRFIKSSALSTHMKSHNLQGILCSTDN